MNNKTSTYKLVILALFSAIIIILSLTPLGYIPINPTLRPTTVHIPVIIGGIILGPVSGGILGAVFALTSLLKNTFEPTITSFVFSPFYSGGNFLSLVICFVPRILIGVFAGWAFRIVSKIDKHQFFASISAGIVGSLTNTILVLFSIYLFFGDKYAEAIGKSVSILFGVIMTIIGTNGVPEAIVAAIITVAVVKPLMALINRKVIR